MSARRRWIVPLAVFLGAFLIYLPTSSFTGGHLDYKSADIAAYTLATTGSPDMDDEPAARRILRNSEWRTWLTVRDGHLISPRSPGAIFAGLPGYWLTQPSAMTLAPAAVTAALIAAGAMLLMYLALVTRLRRREALAAVAALGLTTPVWTIAADGLWPQTLTTLGIAGMAWGAARNRWWVVGVFGGVALWARVHAAIFAALIGLLVAVRRRDRRIVVEVAVPSGLFLLALSAYCRWMYGSWDPVSYRGGSAASAEAAKSLLLDLPNYAGMWIAPDRGVLVWTPVVLVLLPALWRSWRQLPDWSRTLLLTGVVYTLAQSVANVFTGGDYFYGYRLGIEFIVSATPALAFSVREAGRVARALLAPVLGVQLGAMAVGAALPPAFVTEDRVWVDNAYLAAIRWNPTFVLAVTVLALVAVLAVARVLLSDGSDEVETSPLGDKKLANA